MEIVHDPNAADTKRFSVKPPTDARVAALTAMRLWSDVDELARYAAARHGYTNSNSYSGVTYPTDLDEADLADREPIPPGYVEVTSGLADPVEADYLIAEPEYLELLRQYLLILGKPEFAQQVAKLAKSPQKADD